MATEDAGWLAEPFAQPAPFDRHLAVNASVDWRHDTEHPSFYRCNNAYNAALDRRDNGDDTAVNNAIHGCDDTTKHVELQLQSVQFVELQPLKRFKPKL